MHDSRPVPAEMVPDSSDRCLPIHAAVPGLYGLFQVVGKLLKNKLIQAWVALSPN